MRAIQGGLGGRLDGMTKTWCREVGGTEEGGRKWRPEGRGRATGLGHRGPGRGTGIPERVKKQEVVPGAWDSDFRGVQLKLQAPGGQDSHWAC